jgi:tryptophan halogenase
MNRKKITILGAGNAGCVTALGYIWINKLSGADTEIELIYDPNSSPEVVGQATLIDHPLLLWKIVGFDWYNNNIHATFKSGILYEGWGQKNDKWFHPFPPGTMGMHYCPWLMQKTVLESGAFKVIEDRIDNYDDIDSDFIFDCRGKPDDFSNYHILDHPINSVILGQPNWDTSNEYWSRHVATPDGWTFVIPTRSTSPSNNYCVGYCYNKDITSKEDAEKNFLSMFDVNIKKHIEFKNYVAKNPIIDNRIILNGNRLFFLEPLESSSSQSYFTWALMTQNFIMNGDQNPSKYILDYIKKTHNFILWHYQMGSKYETPFWDYAKKFSFEDPFFDKCLEYVKTNPNHVLPGLTDVSYAQWHAYNIKNWYDGVAGP